MSPIIRKAKLAKNQRVDVHAVARRARVSIATVSRTVNGNLTVNPVYAARVQDAINKLGYIPNTQARALVSGRSRLIGVIISDITNPFFPELIQSFEEEAIDSNYEILIGSTAYDSRRMEICIERMLQRKVDGVAVMTFGIEEPLLDRLAAQNIPLVFIDVAPKGRAISAIRVDYGAGIREAVEHLVTLGHRRLAFIAGPKGLHSAESRKEVLWAVRSVDQSGVLVIPRLRGLGGQPTVGASGVLAVGNALEGKNASIQKTAHLAILRVGNRGARGRTVSGLLVRGGLYAVGSESGFPEGGAQASRCRIKQRLTAVQ